MTVKKRFYGSPSFAYIDGGEIHISHRFSNAFVEDCRLIEGRKWNNSSKTNSFPVSSAPLVRALATKYGIPLPEEILRLDDGHYLPKFGNVDQVYRSGDEIFIQFDYNPQLIESIRMFVP